MRTTKMPCRHEELPFVADYAHDYYVRDEADFKAFSPVFGSAFLLKYDPQAKLVSELIAPSVILAQQKAITERIEKHYSTARNTVNKIERYAELADKDNLLKTSISDFGFKKIREDLKNHNDEGVVAKLNEVLQHCDTNSEAMIAKGFTSAVHQETASFIQTFTADVKDQKRKMDEREKLVKDNLGQFDILWDMVSNILNTGQVIYKEKNKDKVKDYTYSELIKKVHQKRKENGDDLPPTATK
jgi:hypothetical protein